MVQYLMLAALAAIAVALFSLLIAFIKRGAEQNSKKASVEGKFFFESKRIVWRVVNLGNRDITIVEVGIMCKDKVSAYRPLYSQTEDINNIPHRISRGDIASYRKEMDKFVFKQSEIDELRIINPPLVFYVKDAEGTVYKTVSDTRFNIYLNAMR